MTGCQGLLPRQCVIRDPRLRFTVTNAILHINPTRPYPGASYVTESLDRLIQDGWSSPRSDRRPTS